MKLGDAIKSLTDAAGIPQCAACKKRQERLNRLGDRALRALGVAVEEKLDPLQAELVDEARTRDRHKLSR
jgi:hypothetical protein